VAHKTGAATYIKELARDIVGLTVLEEDEPPVGIFATSQA
jgi:hypothetical protein